MKQALLPQTATLLWRPSKTEARTYTEKPFLRQSEKEMEVVSQEKFKWHSPKGPSWEKTQWESRPEQK